ncbi:glutaredoxin domain-containing protein [Clostridium sp.]|uniref:glutaredoxin domain-containing protein n=1 Tax=Clostridium sp. TaxID=1506 RepID=UPI003991D55E
MIKLYTMNDCHWCTKEEEYLKSTGKKFDIVNVEKDLKAKKEMINKSHQNQVPVLDVDGKIIVGFNKIAISEAIYGYTWS